MKCNEELSKSLWTQLILEVDVVIYCVCTSYVLYICSYRLVRLATGIHTELAKYRSESMYKYRLKSVYPKQ